MIGVHSCTNLERAYIAQDSLNAYRYVSTVVLKAYISKGTKYWVGKGHEFCSERIVFVESNHILFSRKKIKLCV